MGIIDYSMTILDKFLNGDQAALARIISFIEDREEGYQKVLSRLYPLSGKALKIGFTGPPGAGKSSLVNNIIKVLACQGKKVGVIAVDPTSPFTGGALLGDRIRLTDMPIDGSVYIRSMATRGSTGGLAAATGNVAVALDAFGFEYILIETVGVGQVELDIIDTCDTVVVILVPESGDAIQALKAGLMEIADIFAVNKADRPGSENMIAELNMILEIKRRNSEWELPVVATEAINNKNTDDLMTKILSHLDHIKQTGFFEKHRREQIKRKVYGILEGYVRQYLEDRILTAADLDKAVSEIYDRKSDPFTVSEKLLNLSSLP
ncbi:MAG: methylmalonyl Co-A mutase-associated GTPase MeaB [candidate division Zixibacteria bacterium]|nr:methylmalonyl Co-A mutase-associated GTPase MeaB [candidate division Zixibacteria bacterium]